jgi:hypothetical protein
LEAQAALMEGKLNIVESFFEDNVEVADLREGENSLSDLWFDYQTLKLSMDEKIPMDHPGVFQDRELQPVPEWIDFRMNR